MAYSPEVAIIASDLTWCIYRYGIPNIYGVDILSG
jgi:hypothetical protein